MKWIALGRSGESYPAEVRALRNKSGVYAIHQWMDMQQNAARR